MRINVYSQELTNKTETVAKVAANGLIYYGIRVYLKSPQELAPADQSALTFWIPRTGQISNIELAQLFTEMAVLARGLPEED